MNSTLGCATGREAQRRDTAQTFVWAVNETRAVIAYYSIASTQVTRRDLPGRLAGGVEVSPAILLARLALAVDLRGRRLGPDLLLDALGSMVAAADIVGARLVIVDALHERAAAFYEKAGFRRLHVEGRASLRLAMKMSTARELVRC